MSDENAPLSLRLFGVAEIQVAGIPLPLNDQKARALLFYLAATGRAHTREHLATLLWSESVESNARHSLRGSLYHLRQALQSSGAETVFAADGEIVSLQLGKRTCDVVQFRTLLAAGSEEALRQAAALHRGPLLQGFMLADAPLFEEWLRLARNELSQSYLQALSHLAASAEERQAWNDAISYLQRVIQVDPLAEETQRRLIGLYLRAATPGAALRQYQRFEAELRQELGIAPSRETQTLIQEALKPQRVLPARAKTAARFSERSAQSTPFVGRTESLNTLLKLSQAALAGHGVAVLVQGEDGSGKSRLLDEFVSRLSASPSPWIVLQGSCSPFDDLLSYGPFLDAFQNAGPGDLSDLLNQTQPIGPDDRSSFLWRVLQALRLLSQDTPLLLTIDDLHWANSSTLQLFGFLATRLRNLPVMLVGTVQRAEAIPALQRLVLAGSRHGDVHLLSLAPLTLEEVTQFLLSSGVSPASAAALSEWLHERSGGSPFILLEIMAQLRSEGMLAPVGERWQLDRGRWLRWRMVRTLPQTIHDLLAWRLADLSAAAQRLLEVLAVANQPLPLALLRDFPGIPADDLLPLLDDVLARGWIAEAPGDMVVLTHHLLRETLVHRLSHLRRRSIHRQLAEVVEHCPALQRVLPLRQMALHAVAGEDAERARRYGLEVLAELTQDDPGAETADFLHHLYDLLAPTASLEERLLLTRALGQVHQSLGQLELAADFQQQHLALASQAADCSLQATAHFEIGERALVLTDYLTAISAATAGLNVCAALEATEHDELAARGHRLLGAAVAMEGSDLPAAEQHLQKAAAAHRRANNHSDLCATIFELGNVAAQRGELQRALDFYAEAAHLASTAHVHYFRALAQNNFAYHSLLLGRSEEARRALAEGLKLAETYGLLGALLHLLSTQGELFLYTGEWAAATESFQHGLLLAEGLGHIERQAGYCGGLALAVRGQRDLERATALLEEALTLIAERGYWHLRARLQLWLAETRTEREHLREAQSHLDAALTTARGQNRVLLIIQGERLQARLLAARDEWSTANALFAATLERATKLHLPLESARTQAAWGEALLLSRLPTHNGRVLLADASETFAAHNAHAELAALQRFLV